MDSIEHKTDVFFCDGVLEVIPLVAIDLDPGRKSGSGMSCLAIRAPIVW